MGEVALLKMDVEGYEKYVIEGAVKTLERVKCVLFEASTELTARHESSVLDVIVALKERGFETFEFRDDGELSRSSGAPIAQSEARQHIGNTGRRLPTSETKHVSRESSLKTPCMLTKLLAHVRRLHRESDSLTKSFAGVPMFRRVMRYGIDD
jgi:Methyltransferase FkbM domain